MSLRAGDLVDLTIEKPASGGRMIARHVGHVVLVAGAVPGEHVTARVTRLEKHVAFAEVTTVLGPSSDRRDPPGGPACGGCSYAHIEYPRQLQLKADVIRDAFARIGRIPLERDIEVAGGTEHGYRMRARFHVCDDRAAFYRENTHEPCDPRQTRQLSDGAVDAVDRVLRALAAKGIAAKSVELSENIAADQRALHIEAVAHSAIGPDLAAAFDEGPLTGATVSTPDWFSLEAGDPIVSDPLEALSKGRVRTGALRRHPLAFFQGNRFLIGDLVAAVLDAVAPGTVLDLYAGVGLFAVAIAAAGHGGVTAVEGHPVSAADLERNAAPYKDELRVVRGSVETYLQRHASSPPQTLIVDPPRTGLSASALRAVAAWKAPRIVYVSCDAPTMARDARRLLDAGYRLDSLRAFDLFPNTPHVESLGVFQLRG